VGRLQAGRTVTTTVTAAMTVGATVVVTVVAGSMVGGRRVAVMKVITAIATATAGLRVGMVMLQADVMTAGGVAVTAMVAPLHARQRPSLRPSRW